MNDKEFIDKICCKCINKNNNVDLCNIVKNIKNESQCANFQNETDKAKEE